MEKDINLHVVFVSAFIRKDDKFLLAKRSSKDTQAAGHWAAPGGKVDNDLDDNIIENTLRREVREEVGVEIKDNVKYFSSSAFIRSSGHHVVRLDFIVDWLSGEPQPLEDQDEVRWFTIDEIIELIDKKPHLEYLKPTIQKLKSSL